MSSEKKTAGTEPNVVSLDIQAALDSFVTRGFVLVRSAV